MISRQFPTAATNGKVHYWNPEFVATLSDAELLGVQAHESEHDARHHGTRRGWREPVEWNVAGDFSINIDLVAEGFTLPKGALIDKKYAGLSSEDIYRIRELDKQSEPEPEAGEPEEGEEPGDGGGSKDTSGEEPGEGGSPGEAAGEPGGGTEGDGTGDGDGAPGDPGCGDPGGCGEVLDAVAPGEGNGNETAEADINWDKIVRQAATLARGRGLLPGHVTREIERANNPPRDWRDELREFAEAGALRVETWNRPNKRFVGRGVVLPSSQRDGVNKAVFLIDTSGSMDRIALGCINAEAQALLDDGVVDQVVVVYGDTRVTRVDEYQSGDEMVFDPRGGGGTTLQPLFDHVAEEHEDATLIICFTDGFTDINNDSPEPSCPVLWAFTGYPDRCAT